MRHDQRIDEAGEPLELLRDRPKARCPVVGQNNTLHPGRITDIHGTLDQNCVSVLRENIPDRRVLKLITLVELTDLVDLER